MNPQQGILFAVPGTTCPEARGALEQIDAAASRRFPRVVICWAFTSAPIRRKLEAQGIGVKDPGAALLAMRAEGVTRAVVVSLHLTDGMEFGELAETVAAFVEQPGNRMKVALGGALMATEGAWTQTVKLLLAGLPEKPGALDRVILVAHGSQDPRAIKTLLAAGQVCRRIDPRLILGMMLGMPGRDEVVRECQAAGVQRVWLVPCMVVAGYTAKDDIAGSGEKSWATALARAGMEVVPVVRGLGEIDGVVNLWLNQAEELLG